MSLADRPWEREHEWARICAWREMCQRGQCRYADVHDLHPERRADGCPGYSGTVSLEEGQHVYRYGVCWRRQKWETANNARLRKKRGEDAAAVTRTAPRARGGREE